MIGKAFMSTGTGGTAGFQTVGCVGLGLMGHGICQVAASSGVHSKVIAYEKEQKFLDAGYVKGPQGPCEAVHRNFESQLFLFASSFQTSESSLLDEIELSNRSTNW